MLTDRPLEPEDWRERATEARRTAENLRDQKTRDELLGIARAYDAMAEVVERRRSNTGGPKQLEG